MAPDSGALTSASNTAAAASDQAGPGKNTASAQPSIIIVEILGFGGGDGEQTQPPEKQKDRKENTEARHVELKGERPLKPPPAARLRSECTVLNTNSRGSDPALGGGPGCCE